MASWRDSKLGNVLNHSFYFFGGHLVGWKDVG